MPTIQTPLGQFGFTLEPQDLSNVDYGYFTDRQIERIENLAADARSAQRRADFATASSRLFALADEFPKEENREIFVMAYDTKDLAEDQTLQPAADLGGRLGALLSDRQAFARQHRRERATWAAQPASEAGAATGIGEEAPDAAVQTRRLSWRAGGTWILRDVSVELMPGTVVGLVGPNGAGKTTLLRCLAQDLRPTSVRSRFRSWRGAGRGAR